MGKRQIRIAVSAALQDAGEATRSLEILKGVRDYAPEGYSVNVRFFSHGGKFEQKVLDSGFEIYPVSPALDGVGFHNDLRPGRNNFVGSPQLNLELLKGEISALEDCRPDVILYGFWPFAGIARRIVQPQIPGICFLPLPLEPTVYGCYLMKDVPDQIRPLTYLPIGLRRKIMKAMPVSLKLKAPILRQTNILSAAKECGWHGEPLRNLFDMMKSDLTVVNDLSIYYKGLPIPENFKITGPLYSMPDQNERVDPEIVKLFQDGHKGKTNIFCTMGSSGRKECLLEAIRAVADLPQERFSALVLVPRAVCPLEEAQALVEGKPNILLIERFVPAKLVNAMADLVICHGGQGTVQTALASGTPMVGVAMQPEQQINLDNAVLGGACIRIPITRWRAKNIRAAVLKIAGESSYRSGAEHLAGFMAEASGREAAARAIWDFILKLPAEDTNLPS